MIRRLIVGLILFILLIFISCERGSMSKSGQPTQQTYNKEVYVNGAKYHINDTLSVVAEYTPVGKYKYTLYLRGELYKTRHNKCIYTFHASHPNFESMINYLLVEYNKSLIQDPFIWSKVEK